LNSYVIFIILYCVVYLRVQGTTRVVFVVDIVDATLTNCEVFTQWHAHDAKVAPAWYRRANGIPSPSSNDID
jgi:hypothetical protein